MILKIKKKKMIRMSLENLIMLLMKKKKMLIIEKKWKIELIKVIIVLKVKDY